MVTLYRDYSRLFIQKKFFLEENEINHLEDKYLYQQTSITSDFGIYVIYLNDDKTKMSINSVTFTTRQLSLCQSSSDKNF
jgi:hypothetical protein